MASWPHRHSCSGGKQSGSGHVGKQVGEGEEGNGTLLILLICDLFPPALQFLSKAALTLLKGKSLGVLCLNVYFNLFGGGIIAGIFRIDGLFSKFSKEAGIRRGLRPGNHRP